MKTIDKILILLFALFFAIGAFAEIFCERETNGTWICYGDGYTETVVTNFIGVCSNCVSMSSTECDEVKSRLQVDMDWANEELEYAQHMMTAVQGEMDSLISDVSNWGQVTGNQSVDYMSQNYAQAQYCKDPRGGDNVGGWSIGDNYNRNYYAVCINSLYNYGQYLTYTIEDMKQSLFLSTIYGVTTQLNQLEYDISFINCSECSSSGGGGSSEGGGTCSSGNCPCVEQFGLLNGRVENIKEGIDKLKIYVGDISNMVFQIKKDIRDIAEDSTYITNFVHRLDDYVFDEYTNQVYNIFNNVTWLGELLRSDYSNDYQNISWGVIDSWRRANTFSEYHGDDSPFDNSQDRFNFFEKGRDIFSTTNNNFNVAFDSDLYQNYNWFQRVEFLLGQVAGVFSQGGDGTNAVDRINDFTAQQKAQIDSAQSTYDALEDSLNTPKEIIYSWVSSYQEKIDLINPFKAIKDVSTDDVDSIKFLPEGEYNISDDFSIKIPEIALKVGGEGFERGQAVPYLANIIFNFLWWVIGFIGVGLLLWWYVIQLFKVLEFFHKVHLSWAHTLHLK